MNIVIFGAPGSGKGTQSERLVKKYGLKHVSTGDLLREEMQAKTKLGMMADSYISKGQLVPDDVVIGMLEELVANNHDVPGFIFDGFPRTLPQGKALDEMLAKHGERVSMVLSLELEDKELVDRLLKRGKISGRSDDTKEVIESRLKVYYDQTAPLKEFYKDQGKLVRITGQGSIDEIFESMTSVVDRIIA